jgi:leucyl-tRNA synthetase
MGYDHKKVEREAQEKWVALDLYTTNLADDTKDPYYLLFEFPYPSGDLHIGHWYAFAVTDIFARMLRSKGKNVLFPIGFDAFGLPAENAAMKHGADPSAWTFANIERMKEQIRSMGTSVDWSKEVITCKPEYYHWTQWLFTKLFEHGLAERREASVKWCPKDQTVLANEQVKDGTCDRCGTAVEEKVLTQWFLKITQYAERLLTGLDNLPWREEIKDAQRAWIGKSEGAKLSFKVATDLNIQQGLTLLDIEVFTTRPDTVFGVTYVVLAPEHPLVAQLPIKNKKEVKTYIDATTKKTERERSENKDKTGVVLKGIRAVNPANGEEIPVYIADYVLVSYGTGAVMAVPAHDERDFEFAKKMNLPIKDVVMPRLPDSTNPHVEGKEVVHRVATINIVYDPKTDRYLTLKWKTQSWTTFVTGGVEDGEDPVESAKREIAEETGYIDVRFVRKLGGDAQAEFYAAHKGVNRIARNSMFLFELVSDKRVNVAEEEMTQHELVWIPASELESTKFQHSEVNLIKSRIRSGMDAYTGDGILVHSGNFSGKNSEEAKRDIIAHCGGERTTNYRLRDWLVSRQRYWGCPIPVVYDPEGKPHIIPAEHLPWLLPTDVDFKPTGKAPLASSQELRDRVTKIFGEGWTPEYDTLDTFVDSSWYFLRYLASGDEQAFSSTEQMKKWLPVHRYSGGSEHTTMHLLYARFFTKALYDLALVPVDEPFTERFNRGLILGPDGQKMSKSKGNVINPDEFVEKYGADAVRLYLAFIGPYNEPGNYPWNLDGVTAMRKFLDRVERFVSRVKREEKEGKTRVNFTASHKPIETIFAEVIQKIIEDGEKFKFNTAIAQLMVLLNELEAEILGNAITKKMAQDFIILLAPFAPHVAESLWSGLGGEGSVHQQPWPTAYEIKEMGTITIGVQVNGKHRGSITTAKDAGEEEVLLTAKEVPTVIKALGGREPKRVVYLKGKILNLVV